jgi:hypothetical protein
MRKSIKPGRIEYSCAASGVQGGDRDIELGLHR